MDKKIKLKINGKEFDATAQTLQSDKDPRDTVIKCNVTGLGMIEVIESYPFVGSNESINNIDFMLDITFETVILNNLLM